MIHATSVIASGRSRPANFFLRFFFSSDGRGGGWGLLQSGPMVVEGVHSVAHCDSFANYFTGIIDCIRSDLDGKLNVQNLDVLACPSCPVLRDCFRLVQSKDADRILQHVRPMSCLLNPCLSWLIKSARVGSGGWLMPIVNSSLTSGVIPAVLRGVAIWPC